MPPSRCCWRTRATRRVTPLSTTLPARGPARVDIGLYHPNRTGWPYRVKNSAIPLPPWAGGTVASSRAFAHSTPAAGPPVGGRLPPSRGREGGWGRTRNRSVPTGRWGSRGSRARTPVPAGRLPPGGGRRRRRHRLAHPALSAPAKELSSRSRLAASLAAITTFFL